MFEMSKKEIDKLMMTGFRKIPFTIRRRWSTMWIDRSIWTSEILRPTRTQWTIRLSLAHIRRWWDEDDALQTEGGDPTAVVALTSGRRRRRLRIGGREIRRAEVRNGRRRGSLFLFFFFFFYFLFLLLYYSASFSSPRELKIRQNQFFTPPPGDISPSTEEKSNIPIVQHTKRACTNKAKRSSAGRRRRRRGNIICASTADEWDVMLSVSWERHQKIFAPIFLPDGMGHVEGHSVSLVWSVDDWAIWQPINWRARTAPHVLSWSFDEVLNNRFNSRILLKSSSSSCIDWWWLIS